MDDDRRQPGAPASPQAWRIDSWRERLPAAPGDMGAGAGIVYDDPGALAQACEQLRRLPPLVSSGEIERLRALIADAQRGERFLLQGGDCAETLADCRAEVITAKLKILLQMSLVLAYAGKKPVVRVGRLAGQYAKPRSSPTETRTLAGAATTLPSYFGDLVNRAEFTPAARRPDPGLLLAGYHHAAATLNFVRALMDAGFGDVHHPEHWDLGFLRHAALPDELRARYEEMTRRIADGLRFMEALTDRRSGLFPAGGAGGGGAGGAGAGSRSFEGQGAGSDFYTSHEALNLFYESAQTRTVPRRSGHYLLTTHLPWIGERTRALDGPHVEFFRGIRNPVGVKLGTRATGAEAVALARALNPGNEPGKLVLIPRLGHERVEAVLPGLVRAVRDAGLVVLWACDPMHGNAFVTPGGVKTRVFDHVLRELHTSVRVHCELGSHLGGVHIELTGEDVTECLGGAAGLTEADLSRRYESVCDPRLNYEQAMELAFGLADLMVS